MTYLEKPQKINEKSPQRKKFNKVVGNEINIQKSSPQLYK